MQLARIVFAGVLLFGVSCELPEEGDLMTDQRVAPTSSDDSIDHESEAVAYDSWAIDDATDETMALSSDISEVAIDQAELDALLEEDSDLLGNQKKWECCYCYKHYCYCAKHKKKEKAKDMAEDKCEDKTHKECHFDECEKD